jgi:hypothetical protein
VRRGAAPCCARGPRGDALLRRPAAVRLAARRQAGRVGRPGADAADLPRVPPRRRLPRRTQRIRRRDRRASLVRRRIEGPLRAVYGGHRRDLRGRLRVARARAGVPGEEVCADLPRGRALRLAPPVRRILRRGQGVRRQGHRRRLHRLRDERRGRVLRGDHVPRAALRTGRQAHRVVRGEAAATARRRLRLAPVDQDRARRRRLERGVRHDLQRRALRGAARRSLLAQDLHLPRRARPPPHAHLRHPRLRGGGMGARPLRRLVLVL